MSDDDNEPPPKSLFAKRAKFTPKKSAEELRAAAAILSKVEGERSASNLDEAVPEDFLPVLKKSGKKKGTRQPAEKKDILPDLSKTRLSAAARRRLKKLKEEHKKECAELDAKNAKIFETKFEEVPTFPEESEVEVPENKILALTVSCVSKVARFKCHENENFKGVFEKVANLFHLKPSEFILCLKDRNIAVTDTPKSLSLTELEVLECIPYKFDESTESAAAADENSLKITFQSNDMKSKINMVVSKMEDMQSIMERYSRKRGLPLNELAFEFDGYELVGNEIPFDLDMENGSCIDVRVLIPASGVNSVSGDTAAAGCNSASDDTAATGCSSAGGDTAATGCSSAGGDTAATGCSSAGGDTAAAGCSSASGDAAAAGCSSASGDTAAAGCSSASDDTAVAGSSSASDDTTVAHDSYTSNDNHFIVEIDSDDSDIMILD